MNIALVIDKSGSMGGAKIAQAREAVNLAIDRLGPDDVLSIVAYDNSVHTLVPATKVSDKAALKARISKLGANGGTALFGGVSRGASEVRKFFDRDRVNRVILLSDGMANVGPKSPKEMASLGEKLGGEGITVTTFGIGSGYNEDLMTQLAQASDGNHAYVTKPFMRVSNRLSDATGTGIGLTISRQLARRHGGDVTLLPSEPGCHFCIRLQTGEIQT